MNKKLEKILIKEANSEMSTLNYFWEDSIDSQNLEKYYNKYGWDNFDNEHYYEWLYSTERLREDKINKLFGINKNPTFADIWNKNCHGKMDMNN